MYAFTAAPVRRDGSKVWAVFADLGLDNAIALPELLAEGAEVSLA